MFSDCLTTSLLFKCLSSPLNSDPSIAKTNNKRLHLGSHFLHIQATLQLLFATGIECGIYDLQVLTYQQSVTSRVTFCHLIPSIIIKYLNNSLDVTNS